MANDTTRKAICVSDETLLHQAQEIWELLLRAHKLGYTLTLGPDQMMALIAILENAGLTKPTCGADNG